MALTNKGKAKAELILMGMALPISSKTEAIDITNYVLNVVAKEMLEQNPKKNFGKDISEKYSNGGKNKVKYIVCNTVYGDMHLTFVLESEDYPVGNVDDPEGVFCYTFNITCPWCSEYGYCYFQKRGPHYFRIG